MSLRNKFLSPGTQKGGMALAPDKHWDVLGQIRSFDIELIKCGALPHPFLGPSPRDGEIITAQIPLLIIPSDPVSMATELPHTLTAMTRTLRGSFQSRHQEASMIPQPAPTGNIPFWKKHCSEQSTSQRFRVGNPAQSSLWLKTKEKNLGQQELPYQPRAGQLGARGSWSREELQQLTLPAQNLLTQKGSLAPRIRGGDSLTDPLTPTYLPKSSAPAPAPEIVSKTTASSV